MTTSYDTDFYQWTQAQVEALRAKDWPALDVANLAEEIESLGRSDRRGITHQPARSPASRRVPAAGAGRAGVCPRQAPDHPSPRHPDAGA